MISLFSKELCFWQNKKNNLLPEDELSMPARMHCTCDKNNIRSTTMQWEEMNKDGRTAPP